MKTDQLLVLAIVGFVLWHATKKKEPRPLPTPGTRPPSSTPPGGACEPRVKTGRKFAGAPIDASGWASSRYRTALLWLHDNAPPGVPRTNFPDVARSLVAQWAHESNRGDNEYNFNMGGWKAGKGKPCFEAKDGTSGVVTRWEAFPSLVDAVNEHCLRIVQKWPRAAYALAENPTSDEWIRLLGAGGYYEADPDDYARAWRSMRRWVESETTAEV